MSWPASARWGAGALVALLTLAAARWVGGDDVDEAVEPGTRSTAPPPPSSTGGYRNSEPGATADAFAVRGSVAGQAGVPATAARAPAVAPVSPAAPPLPFVYVGSWTAQGRTSIFVQRDGRSYRIEGPGPLDGEYAVRSIAEDRISLTYLPLGTVQELRLDASAKAPRVARSAPAVQTSREPDAGEN